MIVAPLQVREHYPQLAGAEDDPLLAALISRVDALAAQWCGYPRTDDGRHTLGVATYTRYPRAPLRRDPRALWLGVYPVRSITTAHVSLDWTYTSADLLASTEYVLDGDAGILWITPTASHAWASAERVNRITLTAGYATPPADLVALLCTGVAHLHRARSRSGVSSVTAGGQTVTVAPAASLLPEEVLGGLAPYRIAEYLVAGPT